MKIRIEFCFIALMTFLASGTATAQGMQILHSKAIQSENDQTPLPIEKSVTPPQPMPAAPVQQVIQSPAPLPQEMIPMQHMGQAMPASPAPLTTPNFSTSFSDGDTDKPSLTKIQTAGATTAPLPNAKTAPQPVPLVMAPDFSELRQADTAVAGQVIDPLRIRLRDGRIITLAGIDVPGWDPVEPGPGSLAARDLLKPLVETKQVRMYVTKDAKLGRMTRFGDLLAQLEVSPTGPWVQGALLAAGLARIRPTQRNPEMATQMIALEDEARRGKLGIWADSKYAVATPATAAQHENDWAVVEGTVYGTALNNNTLYLNFGPDWHTDFTVAINSTLRRQMERANINPQGLTGRSIRVRGWLRDYNGPYLELDNMAWLEIQPRMPAPLLPTPAPRSSP